MLARVSAIIVNFNGGEDLITCIAALKLQEYPMLEIVVVDNGSSDRSLERALSEFDGIVAVRNQANRGFAAGANIGYQASTGELLLFLNPDVTLEGDCLGYLVDGLLISPGVVGPTLFVAADAHEEHGCTVDWLGTPIGLGKSGKRPLYVSGCALATSREYFDRLGGFDERFFMFVEDVDYCWRVLLSGGEVRVADAARARHRGGGSARGGYLRSGRIETTAFRVQLRERNTLATLLKCAPAAWFIWLIPAYVAKSFCVATAALVLGRPGLAKGIISGLLWNVRELATTFRRRGATPRTRGSERSALGRISPRLVSFDLIRRFGRPRFVDGRAAGT
jgi:GT2 family glycosyltransferase